MIDSFKGKNFFLSNFYEPMSMWAFGQLVTSSEHAYQAAKCENESDRGAILDARTPGKAKRMGQDVLCRADWEDVKEAVMYTVLRRKFANETLQAKLISTGQECLVEGNTWGDQTWGAVMTSAKDRGYTPAYCWWPPGLDPDTQEEMWIGENLLGITLMKVRSELVILRGL